jgi:CRISPR-associated protein Cas8a1/Csx13
MAMKSLVYRLDDPGFTIYHRAALGGLAATIRAWNKQGVPEPMAYEKDKGRGGGRLSDIEACRVEIAMDFESITLAWDEATGDRKALGLLLKASFMLTEEGMIFLPGQGFGPDREDVLLAIHNAISATFLQHNKKRPGKGTREVALTDDDGDSVRILTYKKIDKYSHQVAQGTDLLGTGWGLEEGEMSETASLPQSLMPGATGGARALNASSKHAFLLHYLMVACPVFLLRSRSHEAKAQNCIVVPDVSNLNQFAIRLHRAGTTQVHRFSNTYLGRVVGGAEEAALRFLIDLRGDDATDLLGVQNLQVIAMGKVAWDKNQQNRSWIARVGMSYPEMAVFEAAETSLGRAKWITTKKGEPFAIPESPVPELVAANLASSRHWCAHFRDLVAKKQDFINMGFRREGLRAMEDAISDTEEGRDDRLVIQAFHEAWKMKRVAFSEGAHKGNLGAKEYWRLVERERERIRNGVLRCKTHDFLVSWFLQFTADASRSRSLDLFEKRGQQLRAFIFNRRNTDRIQNLLLFALVSSPSHDPLGRFKALNSEG